MACGGGGGGGPSDGPPGPSDGPGTYDASHDASPDAPGDAAPDGALDAAGPLICPDRTAPIGAPEHPIPADAVITGDVWIGSAADVDALSGVRMIDGSLTISTTAVPHLVLPSLEVVSGQILLSSGSVETVELPALETADSIMISYQDYEGFSDTVRGVTVPRLEDVRTARLHSLQVDAPCIRDGEYMVGAMLQAELPLERLRSGFIDIYASPNISQLHLPRFEGELWVVFMPGLTTLTAHAPAKLVLENDPMLAVVDVGAPASMDVRLGENLNALTDLDFLAEIPLTRFSLVYSPQITSLANVALAPAMTELRIASSGITTLDVTGPTSIETLVVDGNPALTSVTLADTAVVSFMLRVEDNADLISVAFPALTAANQFVVRENPDLTTLVAPALTQIGLTPEPPSGFARVTHDYQLPQCYADRIHAQVVAASPWLDWRADHNDADGVCPPP
jgi:hypothetical protein